MTSITVESLSTLDEVEFRIFLSCQLLGLNNQSQSKLSRDLTEPSSRYEQDEIWVAKTDREIIGAITLQAFSNKIGFVNHCLLKSELRSFSVGVTQALLDATTDHAEQVGLREIWISQNSILVQSFSDLLPYNHFQLVSDQDAVPKELAEQGKSKKFFVKRLLKKSLRRRSLSLLD